MRFKSIINVVVYIINVVIYIINVVNHINNDVDYTFHQGEEKYSFPRVQLSRIPPVGLQSLGRIGLSYGPGAGNRFFYIPLRGKPNAYDMDWNLKKLLLGLAACCFFAACENDMEDGGEPQNDPKEATFLVYMVGQNDLADELNDNITDLKVGYEDCGVNANVLVYADISAAPTLYLIDKDKSGAVRLATVKTYPDQYSVDPEVMREVINDVFTAYPAARKGVTFSSHADGSLYHSQTVSKRIFGDEGNGNYGINVAEMCDALSGCPHLDLLMFDACLMGSVETAYEFKDVARYYLATPNSVPAKGFPYADILPYLLQMDEAGLTRTSQLYMQYFQENGTDWDDFVSVSLTDLTKMDSLALYMDSLFMSSEVQARPSDINRNTLQRFENGKPLYDFGEWVDSLGLDNPYVDKVRGALERAVVYEEHGEYASVSNYYPYRLEIPIKEGAYCGLNIYVPSANSLMSEWNQLAYFTTLRWYRDAGLWRSPFYNMFEAAIRGK